MRCLSVVLLAALVGCGSPDDDGGGANEMVDAAGPPTPSDASRPGGAPDLPSDEDRTPFTTTGTTPAGSLDDIRFMSLGYIGGHCPGTYYVKLYRTDVPEDQPVVWFSVRTPQNATQPPTGTLAATAEAGGAITGEASFEIVHLDAPGQDDGPETLRIAGRFTVNTPAWNVDFNVDATTPHIVCLIL